MKPDIQRLGKRHNELFKMWKELNRRMTMASDASDKAYDSLHATRERMRDEVSRAEKATKDAAKESLNVHYEMLRCQELLDAIARLITAVVMKHEMDENDIRIAFGEDGDG